MPDRFTLLYGMLAVFWYRLMHRYAIQGVADSEHDPSPDKPDNDPARARPSAVLRLLSRATTMELTTVWFILIAVLWTGYLVLEGFDFGVGMLLGLCPAATARPRTGTAAS